MTDVAVPTFPASLTSFRRVGQLILTAACLVILAGSLSPAPAQGLADRVVVLPPAILDASSDHSTADLWRTLQDTYRNGVHEVEVVPGDEILRAVEGDTLVYDLLALGEAMSWGQALEADAVIQAEVQGGRVYLQRVDPWSGELAGPVDAENAVAAVRELEPERWIYGRGLVEDPAGYQPPTLPDPSRTLSDWLLDSNQFPPDALIQLISGKVQADVLVTDTGVPVEVKLLVVEPPDMDFEAAAAKALWAQRYQPATVDGVPVHGLWKWRVTLHPTK